GNTLLSRYRPNCSSYLYLLRLPFGVSTTTCTSPESGSRALRCSSACAVSIQPLSFACEPHPPATQVVFPVLLRVLSPEGAKTMPIWAVGQDKDEACEGISCRW